MTYMYTNIVFLLTIYIQDEVDEIINYFLLRKKHEIKSILHNHRAAWNILKESNITVYLLNFELWIHFVHY